MPRDPVKIQRNKQISKENKDLDFIQRINNPVLKLEDTSGGPSMTHFMESSDNIAYPRVVNINGKLHLLNSDNAYNYAKNSGEYVSFPNEQQATDYGQTYKQGTPLEEYKYDGKMKKNKIKNKKKSKGPVVLEFPPVSYGIGGYYPNGGDLQGDLSGEGISNNNMRNNAHYFSSGEKTLNGILGGFTSALGLGAVTDAANSYMDPTGQMRNSKEYKTAAGVTGGIAGVGLGAVKSLAGVKMPVKNIPESSYEEGDTTGTAAVGGGNASDIWNAYGGNINIKPSHRGLLHENLGVPQGQPIPSSMLQIHEGDSPALKKRKQFAINAKSWHKDGGNLYPEGGMLNPLPYGTYYNDTIKPTTYREPNWANPLTPVQRSYQPALAQYQEKMDLMNPMINTVPVTNSPLTINKKDYAAGGWIPPQDQLETNHPDLVANAQFTYGNDWYGKLQQVDKYNPIFDQSTYDPNNLYTKNAAKRFDQYMLDTRTTPDLPWKTYDNPLETTQGHSEGNMTKIRRNKNMVEGQENTYSNKKKFGYAEGGDLGLSEANGGFTYRLSSGKVLNFSNATI